MAFAILAKQRAKFFINQPKVEGRASSRPNLPQRKCMGETQLIGTLVLLLRDRLWRLTLDVPCPEERQRLTHAAFRFVGIPVIAPRCH